jgi:hypothetical protein
VALPPQDRTASVEGRLGALYVLRKLAAQRPQVCTLLRAHGAVPLLHGLHADWADEDARHGCASLLRLLGAAGHAASHRQVSASSSFSMGGGRSRGGNPVHADGGAVVQPAGGTDGSGSWSDGDSKQRPRRRGGGGAPGAGGATPDGATPPAARRSRLNQQSSALSPRALQLQQPAALACPPPACSAVGACTPLAEAPRPRPAPAALVS